MELVKPALGLVVWMLVTFGVLVFVLGKYAWKPILGMLKEREQSIEDSLSQAEKARAEIAQMTAKNEEILNQAKEERNKILHEAREAAEKVRTDILNKAQHEAEQKIQMAFNEIEVQKKAAIAEVRNSVGLMALDIATNVLRKELKGQKEQVDYVNTLAKEVNLDTARASSN
jgi:F-type H+-transporting ATPase subunit b